MKLRKLKTLALALSAIVTVNAVSPVAFAEDFTSSDTEVIEAPVVETSDFSDDSEETYVPAEVAEDVAAQESDGYRVKDGSVKWEFDEVNAKKLSKEEQFATVSWIEEPLSTEYSEGEYSMSKKVNTVLKATDPAILPEAERSADAVCMTPGYIWFTTEIDGMVFNSGDPGKIETAFVWKDAAAHNWVEDDRQTIEYPSCNKTGLAHIKEHCKICGVKRDRDVVLDEYVHKFGDPYKIYIGQEADLEKVPEEDREKFEDPAPKNVEFDKNGTPSLIDNTKSGVYYVVEAKKCSICETVEIVSEVIKAEHIWAEKGIKALVVATKNVAPEEEIANFSNTITATKLDGSTADLEFSLVYSEDSIVNPDFPKDKDIELIKCTDPKTEHNFTIVFIDRDNNIISYQDVPIALHHMEEPMEIGFATEDDAKQCTVKWNADHTKYTIVNHSCYLPVTYYEVIHCSADACNGEVCKYYHKNENGEVVKETGTAHIASVKTVDPAASPEGEHSIDFETYKDVKAEIAKIPDPIPATEKDAEEEIYNAIKAIVDGGYHEGTEKFVRISKNNATCEEDGSVTVEFRCKVCKEWITAYTLPFHTPKLGHIPGKPVGENRKDPTCNSQGVYDRVVYCTRPGCGKELSRDPKIIPRLPHTNEIGVTQNAKGEDISMGSILTAIAGATKVELVGDVVVDYNGSLNEGVTLIKYPTAGPDDSKDANLPAYLEVPFVGTAAGAQVWDSYAQDYFVYAQAYTTCTNENCGKHKVYLGLEGYDDEYSYIVDASNNIGIDVISVNPAKKGQSCVGGTIELQPYVNISVDGKTVKVTGEKKVCEYYTSVNEYQKGVQYNGHQAADPVIETNKDGKLEEVVYCKNCKQELSRKLHENHVAGEPEVTEVPATCTEAGSYKSVTKCTLCGEVIESIDKEVPATGHKWETIEENRVESTCKETGSYETVKYCAACKTYDETTREKHEIAVKAHTPGMVVIENMVEATPEKAGSYDLVQYCTVCGEELNRFTHTEEATGVETKIENSVDPTCVKEGSYDLVKYSVADGKEISRETVKVEALGHTEGTPVSENEVPSTCEKLGTYDVVTYCTVCGEELHRVTKEEKELAAHTPGEAVKENVKEATCEEEGSYDEVVYCTVCKKEISRDTVKVEALDHTPGEAVKENEVAPTALKDGSYDEVVYCTVCNKEISRETKVVPATGDYTVPAKVTGIKTTANEGKQKIRVEWPSVSGAYKYRVYWKAHGEADYQKKDTANLSYTISNLTPNTLYDIRVRAAAKVDDTYVWGATSGVYRRWLKTVETTYTKTANSITVNITPVDGAVKYQIHVSEYKDMTDETVKSVKATTTSYTIKGLDPATKYFIRVRPITTADGKNYTGALNSVKGVTTKKK